MAEDQPTIVDLLRTTRTLAPDDTRFPWPAIVDSFDASTGRAVVCPAPRLRDRLSGQAYDLGPVEVPVVWFGTGSVIIDSELVKGDEVLLVPTGPSLRAWLDVGGVTDGQGRGQSLGEAVAFPVRLSGPRRPGAAGVRLRLGDADGSGRITIDVSAGGEVKIEGATVELGAGAKLAVARDTDAVIIAAAYTTFVTQVTAFLNSAGPLVGPAGITPVVSSTVGTIQASSTEVSSS
jgi:hypothetical protein